MGRFPFLHGLIILLAALGVMSSNSYGQSVQDDSLAQDWFFHGVGADSVDYLSQSFIADVNQVFEFSVWLDVGQPDARVQLLFCGDDGNGFADVNNPLYRSSPIIPPGGWHRENVFLSTFIGQKYWIVVEGINIPGASGYAIVGTSFSWTDAREHMYASDNGGNSWERLTERIAIDVKGEVCTTPLTFSRPGDTIRVCFNDSIDLNVGFGFYEYSWSNGANTPETFLTPADLGLIKVEIVDSSGCLGEDSIYLRQFPIDKPDFGPERVDQCEGQEFPLFPGSQFVSYAWNTGDSVDLLIVDTTGLYICNVEDVNGCHTSDSILLVFHEKVFFQFGTDTSFCFGGNIFLDASGPFRDWVWSNGATTPSINANVSGEYFVIFSDSFECAGKSDTLVLEVFDLPDTPSINLQEDLLISSPQFAYQWYLEGIPIPGATGQTILPELSGSYLVEISDSNSCTSVSDPFVLNLDYENLMIPEGFSPNGDGYNDAFVIDRIFFYPESELIIMNRWGQEVYREAGYENGWQGTNQAGEELVDGHYFYILDPKNGLPPYQGPVYIKR